MASTDPLADMLAALHNASVASLEAARLPDSRFKQSVLKALQSEGFIKSFRTTGEGAKRVLEIHLAYGPKREKLLTGLKRVSRPGRRVYVGVEELGTMLRRLEVPFVSTPQGVFSGPQAFARRSGGELLCLVW